MADDTKVRPKIDDAYWFDYSENLINQHLQSRNEAADKLQNLVLWLWGIYTTLSSVGFALSEKDISTDTKILIACGSAALIIVYWLTVWAQMPVLLKFDPRSPTQIKKAYVKSVTTKSRRLNITIFFSLIASIMVIWALMAASTSVAVTNFVPVFSSAISPVDTGATALAVNAKIGDATKVTLTVEPVTPKTPHVFRYILLPTKEGSIQCSVAIKQVIKEARVSLEWQTKDAMKIRLTQSVASGSPAKPVLSPTSSGQAVILQQRRGGNCSERGNAEFHVPPFLLFSVSESIS